MWVQLVENRDELLVERLIEEARQTERHEIEHLPPIDEAALHLIVAPAALGNQSAVAEAQRSHAGLQSAPAPLRACVMPNSRRETSRW